MCGTRREGRFCAAVACSYVNHGVFREEIALQMVVSSALTIAVCEGNEEAQVGGY